MSSDEEAVQLAAIMAASEAQYKVEQEVRDQEKVSGLQPWSTVERESAKGPASQPASERERARERRWGYHSSSACLHVCKLVSFDNFMLSY